MSRLDVNANVQNNVILYKYERNAYFRNIKIFGVGQLFGWSILALYTYKPSFWDIFTTNVKLREYWLNHLFRLGLFVFSIIAGKNHSFYTHIIIKVNILYIREIYTFILNSKQSFIFIKKWR